MDTLLRLVALRRDLWVGHGWVGPGWHRAGPGGRAPGRLARNNTDWHRLLEICALTETLILDEDGVYDPAAFNDRLMIGFSLA